MTDDLPEKSPMIERLQRIASVLLRVQALILLSGLVFMGLFAWGLFQLESDRNTLMLPALAGFCWSLLLFAFARLFNEVPERPQSTQRLGRRWSLKIRRALMSVMAVLMLLLTLAVIVLSYQLLRTNFTG